MARNYYKIRLGTGNVHAGKCYEKGFIGGDWTVHTDLSADFEVDASKEDFVQEVMRDTGRTKRSAYAVYHMLCKICKEIQEGDIVLSPKGENKYLVGEIVGGYEYSTQNNMLPHRRPVTWLKTLSGNDMGQQLQKSVDSRPTVSSLFDHKKKIDALLENNAPVDALPLDEADGDLVSLALEKQLEDFLVENWSKTRLGDGYKILEEDGECVGQQYRSDTGPIDILAISKDEKEYLVVELKKGRASDVVVAQVQRYMGFVKSELAERGQGVRGIVIALDNDIRIQRALSVTDNIDFYRYEVSFELFKN